MSLSVAQALTDADRALGRAIRHAVFVEEQHVPPELELDGLDDQCDHYLVRLADGEAVATARTRTTEHGWKIERVAVARPHRRRAVGAALVRYIQSQAPRGRVVYLHAQERALGFWEGLGFVAEGPRFMEADIAHRVMQWRERATLPTA